MKLVLSAAAVVVLLSACVPPTTPSGFGPPGAGPGPGGAPAVTAAPGASCRATLECYAACDPVTPACMQACDQAAAPADAELAHAGMACIANSGCADQDCVVARCATELTACTEIAQAPALPADGAAPTTTTIGSGGFDLAYQVPAGWTEQRGAGMITVAYTFQDSYTNRSYQLLILPSQPRRGSLTDTYRQLWADQIASVFATRFEPAPMRRRLASGLALWLDGDVVLTARANNAFFDSVVLYMVVADDRVIPIVGLYRELESKPEAPFVAFFDGLSLPGVAATPAPLFDASELVGTWNTHSHQLANYVDSSGNYRGDASVTTGEELELRADGSYRSYFAAFHGSGGRMRESHDGSWRLDDDTLTLAPSDEAAHSLRVLGLGTLPGGGGAALRLPPGYDGLYVVELTRPRRSGEWYGRVD